MNKKGFSLIELLATLVILGTVMGIATYTIISILNSSKEKNYALLIDNIRGGAEVYYQECKYSRESILTVFDDDSDAAESFCDYQVKLGELVEYGYVTGNKKDASGKYVSSVQLSDPLSMAFILDDGSSYTLEIVVNDESGKEIHNAADEIYTAKRTPGTRLAIRFSCCILPLIFMTAGLLIQRKKFIIDEEYFDKMMVEIEERKQKELKSSEE